MLPHKKPREKSFQLIQHFFYRERQKLRYVDGNKLCYFGIDRCIDFEYFYKIISCCGTEVYKALPETNIACIIYKYGKDYANGDYTPASGGPLYNAGANYEGMASVDLAGNPRKIGSKIDIGCYEASSSAFMIIVR